MIDWAATSLLLDTASNASKQQQQTNGPLIFTLVVVFGGAISVIAIRCMKRSGGLLDEQGRYDALNDFKARKVSMTARQIALNGSGGGGFEGFVGTSTGGGNGRREGRGVGVASDSMELRRYGLTGNNNGAGFTFLDDDDEEMDAIAVATRKF